MLKRNIEENKKDHNKIKEKKKKEKVSKKEEKAAKKEAKERFSIPEDKLKTLEEFGFVDRKENVKAMRKIYREESDFSKVIDFLCEKQPKVHNKAAKKQEKEAKKRDKELNVQEKEKEKEKKKEGKVVKKEEKEKEKEKKKEGKVAKKEEKEKGKKKEGKVAKKEEKAAQKEERVAKKEEKAAKKEEKAAEREGRAAKKEAKWKDKAAKYANQKEKIESKIEKEKAKIEKKKIKETIREHFANPKRPATWEGISEIYLDGEGLLLSCKVFKQLIFKNNDRKRAQDLLVKIIRDYAKMNQLNLVVLIFSENPELVDTEKSIDDVDKKFRIVYAKPAYPTSADRMVAMVQGDAELVKKSIFVSQSLVIGDLIKAGGKVLCPRKFIRYVAILLGKGKDTGLCDWLTEKQGIEGKT